MDNFITQFTVMLLAAIPPMMFLAKESKTTDGFYEWLSERSFKLFGTAVIFFITAALMANLEIDVISVFSTGFAIPVLGGSLGYGVGVSFLMLK